MMSAPKVRSAGFTLIELLVALSIMALLTVLSWRGIDGMSRAQDQLRLRSDELLTLQTGLAQWGADLDALALVAPMFQAQAQAPTSLDWNGQVLRIIRFSAAPSDTGLRVVAWTRRDALGGAQWLRWQSSVVHTRGELRAAWEQAAVWGQSPGAEQMKNEVAIVPLAQWQIFYFRENAWSHPLSSASRTASALPATPSDRIPDGVRLVLTLPAGQVLGGTLTRDWIRRTGGEDKP